MKPGHDIYKSVWNLQVVRGGVGASCSQRRRDSQPSITVRECGARWHFIRCDGSKVGCCSPWFISWWVFVVDGGVEEPAALFLNVSSLDGKRRPCPLSYVRYAPPRLWRIVHCERTFMNAKSTFLVWGRVPKVKEFRKILKGFSLCRTEETDSLMLSAFGTFRQPLVTRTRTRGPWCHVEEPLLAVCGARQQTRRNKSWHQWTNDYIRALQPVAGESIGSA